MILSIQQVILLAAEGGGGFGLPSELIVGLGTGGALLLWLLRGMDARNDTRDAIGEVRNQREEFERLWKEERSRNEKLVAEREAAKKGQRQAEARLAVYIAEFGPLGKPRPYEEAVVEVEVIEEPRAIERDHDDVPPPPP